MGIILAFYFSSMKQARAKVREKIRNEWKKRGKINRKNETKKIFSMEKQGKKQAKQSSKGHQNIQVMETK